MEENSCQACLTASDTGLQGVYTKIIRTDFFPSTQISNKMFETWVGLGSVPCWVGQSCMSQDDGPPSGPPVKSQ